MIVFTCINAAMTDAALVWAHSLRKATQDGKADIQPFIFHTPDVDTSRFADFNVNCVRVDHPNIPKGIFTKEEMNGMTMRLRVLDMMIERKFAEKVLYVDADVLFQKNLDELEECPLTDRVWLAARNDNVYFDCKRNGKFYKDYNPYSAHKAKINPDYFNSGVMLIKLKGLKAAVQRKGHDKLLDYFLANQDDYIFPDQDCMNSLIGEHFNLFDRYNCFAELVLHLDFGDLLGRREEMRNAHIVHYCGVSKPWKSRIDNGLPRIHSSQYRYEDYLAVCDELRTYLSTEFYRGVKENVTQHSLIIDWQKNVREVAGPLKKRLEDFKETLKEQEKQGA